MGPRRTAWSGAEAPQRAALERAFADEGLAPQWWSNDPGATYGWHEHPYRKVLYCAEGTIVFHTTEGDVGLEAGDRLDLPPRTPHAATVGSQGVVCVEAEA